MGKERPLVPAPTPSAPQKGRGATESGMRSGEGGCGNGSPTEERPLKIESCSCSGRGRWESVPSRPEAPPTCPRAASSTAAGRSTWDPKGRAWPLSECGSPAGTRALGLVVPLASQVPCLGHFAPLAEPLSYCLLWPSLGFSTPADVCARLPERQRAAWGQLGGDTGNQERRWELAGWARGVWRGK